MCGDTDFGEFCIIIWHNSLVLCKYLCYFTDTLNIRQLFAEYLRILAVYKPEERDANRF